MYMYCYDNCELLYIAWQVFFFNFDEFLLPGKQTFCYPLLCELHPMIRHKCQKMIFWRQSWIFGGHFEFILAWIVIWISDPWRRFMQSGSLVSRFEVLACYLFIFFLIIRKPLINNNGARQKTNQSVVYFAI